MMHVFGYPEALHALLQLGEEVVLQKTISAWYLKRVFDRSNPVASIPVIVRIQEVQKPKGFWNLIQLFFFKKKETLRFPWQPNNSNLHASDFCLRNGKSLGGVTFVPGTAAWAFDQVLRHKKRVAKDDWPKGMHIRDIPEDDQAVVHLFLANGKMVKDEYRPDFADVAGNWILAEE